MQPTFNNILFDFGLTDNEIKIYEALLKKKSVIASSLAHELKLDKSSTYRALENLVTQNLVMVERKARGTTYSLGSLDILKDNLHQKLLTLKNKEASLDTMIENIKKSALSGERDTYITVEKGLDAHKKLMEISLTCHEKLNREKFPFNGPIFDSENYNEYAADFLFRRVAKKIDNRTLYNFTESRFNRNLMRTDKKIRKEVRILPSEIDNNNYLKIWDDYTEIVSFNDNKTDFIVICVKDNFVATLMKSFFDYIWTRSATYFGQQVLPTRADGTSTHSVIGIGTWGVGGYATKNPYTNDTEEVDQLRNSLGQGINYVDTSHAYGGGYSLPLIAKAIKNFPRESLFINSKIGYMVKKRSDVRAMCEHYLAELGTEYVDRLMIHAPRAIEIPIEDVVEEIDKLIDEGKAKSLGVSNFNVEQLKRVIKVARHPLAAHEIHYNLMIRANEENGVVDYCNARDILLIAFQPLRRGFLVGLEDPTLAALANKYQKTQSQIILNWLAHKKNMMFLVKATRGTHINENVAALGWDMLSADYKKLDAWRMPGYATPVYDQTGNAPEGIKIDKL